MHVVYVHDANVEKENGNTLLFCSNYLSISSRRGTKQDRLTLFIEFGFQFHSSVSAMPSIVDTSFSSISKERVLAGNGAK